MQPIDRKTTTSFEPFLKPQLKFTHLIQNLAKYKAKTELARRELAAESLLQYTKLNKDDYDPGWLHVELCRTLEQFVKDVEDKKSPRLIIQVPPRRGKSEIVSRNLPPFTIGKHPDWEVIVATYGQTLADKMGRDIRTRLQSPLFSQVFPDCELDPQRMSVDDMGTKRTGGIKCTGVGGALTGMGGHIAIVDDPFKDMKEADSELIRNNVWEWFDSVLCTRIAPGGGIVILMTRWHEDDLAGRLQEKMRENSNIDQYTVFTYPEIAVENEKHRRIGEVLHPERFPPSAVHKIKMSRDVRTWNALYQQNPTPEEGLFFDKEDLEDALYKPAELPKYMKKYVSCDFAISTRTQADFTVALVYGVDEDGVMWLLPNIYRKKEGNAHKIVNKVLKLAKDHNALSITVENGTLKHAMDSLFQKRMMEMGKYFSFWTPVPVTDKVERATPLKARLQAKMIRIPDTRQVQEHLMPEMLGFPAAKHDDFVDAFAWACQFLHKQIVPTRPKAAYSAPIPEEGSYEALYGRDPDAEIESNNNKKHVPRGIRRAQRVV